MQQRSLKLAQWFWPSLAAASLENQLVGAVEVLAFLFFAPIALLGLLWLAALTDATQLRNELPLLLLIAILAFALGRLKYFIITRLWTTRLGSAEGSLASALILSGVFLFGPLALWIAVSLTLIGLTTGWDLAPSAAPRWRLLRQAAMELVSETIAPLAALLLYARWGGAIPIAGLQPRPILLGLAALLVSLLVQAALWSVYLAYHAWARSKLPGGADYRPLASFFYFALALPHLAHPFGVLAAGLYVENGLPAYLFFITGLLLVGLLGRQLSWAAERSRQQSQALSELERLSHSVIMTPPDSDRLPRLLAEHLPGMFPSGQIGIWRFPDQVIFRQPDSWNPDFERIWPWLARRGAAQGFLPKQALPWGDNQIGHSPVLIAPILEPKDSLPIGGIYLALRSSQPWDRRSVENLVPVVQSLASLIASAINQTQAYATQLQFERISQELRLAGEIQSGLIPFDIPRIPGWQVAVTLDPAGETSGDFFDFIPLPEGKIGLVIADVVDKGIGAALYMALSRTLLRTYAIEADSDPQLVFFATNSRMIADATSNLFVTAFYGVLDPKTGRLSYCNAGHNPPYLVRSSEKIIIQELIRTGLPIGVQEGARWTKAAVQLEPGDRLILYTDGVPDARNQQGEAFTIQPFLEVAKKNLGLSAEELQSKLLQEISGFVGTAPQSDDITLMVLARDPPS